VDEATVTVENIHRHQEMGKRKARASPTPARNSSAKIIDPAEHPGRLCTALFMHGCQKQCSFPIPRRRFAMIASFLLSQTFVPVIASFFLSRTFVPRPLRPQRALHPFRRKFHTHYILIATLFILIATGLAACSSPDGYGDLSTGDSGQAQVRLRLLWYEVRTHGGRHRGCWN